MSELNTEENVALLKGGFEYLASLPNKRRRFLERAESQKLIYKNTPSWSGFIIEATGPEEVRMDRQTDRRRDRKNKNPRQSVLMAHLGRPSCVLRAETHTRQATSVLSLG